MNDRSAFRSRFALVLLLVALATLLTLADPPDSKVNPQSGYIETADPVWSGTQYDVDHVTDFQDSRTPDVFAVSTDSDDDRDPKIEISADGDTWVVWWRDQATDEVRIRKRNYSTKLWTGERLVSESNESSRNPAIAHDGTEAWVAYEFDSGSDTAVAVLEIFDEPDPVPVRTLLDTTSFTGSLDTKIHVLSGHLWVTWVDSSSNVGWSEYDYTNETWGLTGLESYANDDVPNARKRIEGEIVDP